MFQFFVAPPLSCPQPRWYSTRFSDIFEAFSQSFRGLPSNVHLIEMYMTDLSMFELSGFSRVVKSRPNLTKTSRITLTEANYVLHHLTKGPQAPLSWIW